MKVRPLVNVLVASIGCAFVACDDDSAEKLDAAALLLVPSESEVVRSENCGESLMTGDCSILYLDTSWGDSDARLAAYRERAYSAGWAVRDANVSTGLVLTRKGYFGTVTLARSSRDTIPCPARDNPEYCADVINIEDK